MAVPVTDIRLLGETELLLGVEIVRSVFEGSGVF